MVAKSTLLLCLLVIVNLLPEAVSGQEKEACPCSHACRCHLVGTVLDAQSGEPLPYANILLVETDKVVVADEHGHFSITNLCSCNLHIRASFTGYKTYDQEINFNNNSNFVIKLAESSEVLESVVVEGKSSKSSMASMATSTINKASIERNRGENLAKVLQQKSGLGMIETGSNISKPVINGLSGNRIQILNNDVRFEGQQWGAEHSPAIDVFGANDIEIIKGASSVKYGPNAMGGVVLVNPEPIHMHEGLAGEAHMIGMSNGMTGAASLMLEGGFKKPEHLGWRIQGSYKRGGDLSTPDYDLTNTGIKEINFSAAMAYQWKNNKLDVYYSNVSSELGLLKTLGYLGSLEDLADAITVIGEEPKYTDEFSYDIEAPYQSVAHHLGKLKFQKELSIGFLSFQYAFQLNDRQEYDIRRGSLISIPSMDLQLTTHTADLALNSNANSLHQWEIGFSGLYQQNSNIHGTQTIPFIPNYSLTSAGLYAIDKYAISSKVMLEAGLRGDFQHYDISGYDYNNDLYHDEISLGSATATAGLSWKINKENSIKSNIGLAWRPPHVSELYCFGKHQSAAAIEYGLLVDRGDEPGVSKWEDSDVEPEKSYKWVTQYNLDKRNFNIEASAYVQFIRNYIFSRPEDLVTDQRGTSPAFWYNQTNAVLHGLDFEVKYNIIPALRAVGQASITRAKDVLNDDYFLYIPSDRYRIAFEYTRKSVGKFQNLYATIGATAVTKQNNAPRVITVEELMKMEDNDVSPFDDNDKNFDILEAPDGYVLTDMEAGISKKTGSGLLDFHVGVENMLNTTYRAYTNRLRYYADDLGRNITIGLTYHF